MAGNPFPAPTWQTPARGSIAYNPKPVKVKNIVGSGGVKTGDSPNFRPGVALKHILTTHDAKSGVTSFHAIPQTTQPRPNVRAGKFSPTPAPARSAVVKAKAAVVVKKGSGKANVVPAGNAKTNAGAGTGITVTPSVSAPASYAPAAVTQKQLSAYAAQVANAQLAPQLAGNQSDIDTANQQSADHAAAIAGFSKAMGSLLAPIGGNISSAYGNAADAVASYGQGFSASNDQLKQDAGANASGADPTMNAAQQAEIAKGYAGTPYDVMYGMNGYDPATSLRGVGAAQGALASKLPQVAANYGSQWLGSSQADALKNLAALQKTGAGIRAQYPGLYNTALAAKHSSDNQDASLAITKAAAEGNLTGSYTGADGKLHPTAATVKATAAQVAANTKAAAAGHVVNTTMSGQYGYQFNNQGEPILDAKGKAVPYPMSKTGQAKVSTALSKAYGYLVDTSGNLVEHNGKPVPMPNQTKQSLTTSQVLRYHGVASDIAKNAFQGFTDSKGVVHPKVSLGAAMQLMRSTSAGKIPADIARAELARWYNPTERKRLGN